MYQFGEEAGALLSIRGFKGVLRVYKGGFYVPVWRRGGRSRASQCQLQLPPHPVLSRF